MGIESRNIFSAREAAIDSRLTASLADNALVGAQKSADYSKPVTLAFVGDVMLSRAVGSEMKNKNNYDFPFLLADDFLKNSDITFGNLEGPISDRGINQGSVYSFRDNPRAVEGLVYAGFDVMSLANNHIFDWGRDALMDTATTLTANGIVPIGVGKNFDDANSPAIIESGNLKVAFLAYTNLYPKSLDAGPASPGISEYDVKNIDSEVKKIKNNKQADIVVVSLHWGTEYETHADEWQKDVAHLIIDAGADVVVGHHPHVTQEVELYKNGVIFYSLGNFVFDQPFSQETTHGLAAKVEVSKDGLKSVQVYNVPINKFYQPEISTSSEFVMR